MRHLITNPSDIYYLTGVRPHDSGEILLVIQEKREKIDSTSRSSKTNLAGMTGKGIIFCDQRTSALFDTKKFHIIDDRKQWGDIFKKFKKLQTDPDFLTHTLRAKIEGYGLKLIMKKSPVTERRIIKNDHEIQLIRESQKLNKQVYKKILPFLKVGVTEEAIARKIQILQLELGASGPSFPPIVAFGENTAVPHHSPTSRKLQPGDPILIDMGLVYQGYCSDLTRCTSLNKKEKRKKKKDGAVPVILGQVNPLRSLRLGGMSIAQTRMSRDECDPGIQENNLSQSEAKKSSGLDSGGSTLITRSEPACRQAGLVTPPLRGNDGSGFDEIYSLLQHVTNSIISWAKPGMKVADLDKKARKMLGKYEKYFTHSLGHGVGIDIHEMPYVSSKSKDILEQGMVITIEPGLYFPPGIQQVQSAKCIELRSLPLDMPVGISPVQNGGILKNPQLGTLNSELLTYNEVVFGARYEEMVLVDKERLRVL